MYWYLKIVPETKHPFSLRHPIKSLLPERTQEERVRNKINKTESIYLLLNWFSLNEHRRKQLERQKQNQEFQEWLENLLRNHEGMA